MANDEALGPRKTMFILVIVVGCFAVLWPRILSPIIVGHQKQHLQPNQFDRDAGCCEVMFESELAVLELINEVCSSAVHIDGKISPHAAAACRKAVNETCGVDIVAFLKRTENVGKTSKILVQTMQRSNSSCLKEHFGVPVMSLGPHLAYNSWTFEHKLKQERPSVRSAGPHPALRERGRAIPAGTPAPSPRGSTIQMPAHVRVRSPLQGYFDLDIKPPPIPGMRPPLGSPGGPVPAPKSSMGFVMPIYTICIILFFVYTISKIFFKRATIPYEPVEPSPQFRKRVFRDDSRTTPDKFGHKERDTIVTAISGLVAEVRQQMEASYTQNQQTQERQDNHNNSRPYTNGTVLHNTGPVHIIASEYQAKDKIPEPKETSPEAKLKSALEEVEEVGKDVIAREGITDEKKENVVIEKKAEKEVDEVEIETKDTVEEVIAEAEPDKAEIILEKVESNHKPSNNLVDLSEPVKKNDFLSKVTEDFIQEAKDRADDERAKLLEEALNDEEQEIYEEEEEEEVEEDEIEDEEPEKSSVKVMGMEVRAESADGGAAPTPAPAEAQSHAHRAPPAASARRAPHEAAEVTSIFLDTELPQAGRLLVDFDGRAPPAPARHSPMVVSGKMTLSLIQDAPRDTPERDAESTVDDFTTASAVTQDAAEKEGSESEEEIEEVEEEVEVEEIEEEVEEEEEIEEQPKKAPRGTDG